MKPKTPRVIKDQVVIDESNRTKLDAWREQLTAFRMGSRVSRKELVNFWIDLAPKQLPTGILKDLADQFFDEERFVRAVLEEVRQAKSRGEQASVLDRLGPIHKSGHQPKPRSATPKNAAPISPDEKSPEIS